MGYKDNSIQKEYQRIWMNKRRANFFADKFCINCNSFDELELDHIDKTKKVSHRIWSWSEERRNEEISKCQILCRSCHIEKSKRNDDYSHRGSENSSSVLTEDQVLKIRDLVSNGESQYSVSKKFGVGRSTINDLILRRTWTHI